MAAYSKNLVILLVESDADAEKYENILTDTFGFKAEVLCRFIDDPDSMRGISADALVYTQSSMNSPSFDYAMLIAKQCLAHKSKEIILRIDCSGIAPPDVFGIGRFDKINDLIE